MSTDQRLGKYRLVRRLGAGSFATVHLAIDEQLDDQVALKVLAENWSHDDEMRRRFVEEARVLRRLDDERVVRVHAIEETGDGRPYIVMTYADRGTLQERMADHRDRGLAFTRHEAVRIVSAVADALDVVHAHGIVHRDLKPSNVLFRSAKPGAKHALSGEQLLLGDFGLAKDLARGGTYTRAAGTPAYMAPEQATWGVRLDRRVDVFALAAITYELLSGRPAYSTTSLSEVAADRGRLTPVHELVPDLPESVNEVLETGLAHDAADRFGGAGEFVQALERALAPGRRPGADQSVIDSVRPSAAPDLTLAVGHAAAELAALVQDPRAQELTATAQERMERPPVVAVVDDGSGRGLDLAWRLAAEPKPEFADDRRFDAVVSFTYAGEESIAVRAAGSTHTVAVERGEDGRIDLDLPFPPSSIAAVELRLKRSRLRRRSVLAVPSADDLTAAVAADVVVLTLPDDGERAARLVAAARDAVTAVPVPPIAVLGVVRSERLAETFRTQPAAQALLLDVFALTGARPGEHASAARFTDLTDLIDLMLVQRADVVRASGAYLVLERVIGLPAAVPLRRNAPLVLERVRRLPQEVPLLDDALLLRRDLAGKVPLPGPLRSELRRVLVWADAPRRLGLPASAPPAEQRAAAEQAVKRWRSHINSGRVPFAARPAAERAARAFDRLWTATDSRKSTR